MVAKKRVSLTTAEWQGVDRGYYVGKSAVLRKAREKHAASQRSVDAVRRSSAGDSMMAHVKLDCEWSPLWDAVVRTFSVCKADNSTLCRSTTPCPSWIPVIKGVSGTIPPSDRATSPPVPMFASTCAFLEDNDDDNSNGEVIDPLCVPMVGRKAQQARVARDELHAKLVSARWSGTI